MDDWRAASRRDFLLSENPSDKDYVCVIDSVYCDLRPLTHCFLSWILKSSSENAMVLLTFDKPLSEFMSCSRRLGHDINLASIQNRFMAIDFVGPINSNLSSKFYSSDPFNICDEIQIENIQKSIRNFVDGIPEKQKLTIVIDGISLLSILGIPSSSILGFIKMIESFGCNIYIRLCKDTVNGPKLASWICHRANTMIISKALSSGMTRQVHGDLIVLNNTNTIHTYLFKTTDNSILLQSKRHENLDNHYPLLDRIDSICQLL